MQFIEFLIEKIDNITNEADIVLHQIINNVDESHVDYNENRLDFNIGILIKRSEYSRLYMTIFKEKEEFIDLAKNNNKDGFTIVVKTSNYPNRMEIDNFLSNTKIYNSVKKEIVTFIDEYYDDTHEVITSYEASKEVNTDENFENLYNTIINGMKDKIKEYKNIAEDLNKKLETTANEAERQTLVRSLEKLQDEYFGNTFKKFKKIAVGIIEIDMTRLEKEYKRKLDTRLENFYEYITNNILK
jgi:hypothetical protein